MHTRTIVAATPTVTFAQLTVKTIVVHTVTYTAMGLLALNLLNYRVAFDAPITREYLRSVDAPIVALGPSLQFIRGVLFAIAFYPLRDVIFGRKNGWQIMWLLLVMLGILGPFAAAPGSVEGVVYTKLPLGIQLSGWLEIVPQALLLSVVLHQWINHPEKRWIAWVLGAVYLLAVAASILGFVLAPR